MSALREAAQQALEALEYTIKPLCMCWAGCEDCEPSKAPDIEKAITALRTALAQKQAEPVQESVATRGYARKIEELIAQRDALLATLRDLVQLEADGRTEYESSIEHWDRARAAIAKYEENT